jgi:alpha,alpha-trehalase
MKSATRLRQLIISACLFVLLSTAVAPAFSTRATGAQLGQIRDYIKQSWHTLTRSNAKLADAAVDPKFKPESDGRWPVYVSASENLQQVEQKLKRELSKEDLAKIDLRLLPEDTNKIQQQGLLYLPYPYVVPGGRFNEMYGWDSYFIQIGLLRDGEIGLAKNVIDNFIYQVEHYGKILNANRTYYLTRSQPPFITQMVLGVYRKTHDLKWLRSTVPAIEKTYTFWTSEPHLTKQTALSRYYDFGQGPSPEVLSDERDAQGRTHYDRVKEYYRTHDVTDYDVGQYYDKSKDELTAIFYKGDRSMRESGFDPSNRFGPFNIDIIHYNPVCLNSLLYLIEVDAAQIMKILGRTREAKVWVARAAERRNRVNKLMWDEKDGLYYDYNFTEKRVRRYPFLTTFYPLWVGIAVPKQASRVVANLSKFEEPGGLQTSTLKTGNQWDAPFGWAPLQIIAVKALRRYGYQKEANRVTENFLSMLLKDFIEHNTIVEKYDVERRSSQLGSGIRFGYAANQIGFGWTNAAFTELYAELPQKEKPNVRRLDGVPLPGRSN